MHGNEIFCKKQKSIMDEFIVTNQKYARWFGDTVGGVKEVKKDCNSDNA